MVNSKNMRYNPYWYQGLDYVGEDNELSNINEDIDMNGHGIVNLKDPVNDQDAVSKKYVDDAIAAGGGGTGGGPLQASQIHSQAVGNIQSTNVQDVIQEISSEAAFLDSANVFTGEATFNQVPKLGAATAASNDPKALASVEQVSNLIAAKKVKAAEVSVDQTTPLQNLQGTNVQGVIQEVDQGLSKLKDRLDFVGTYDIIADKVVEVVGAASSGLVANSSLPAASADNVNMYLLVKTKGRGTGNAPTIELNPGDIIYSDGNGQWHPLFTSINKTVQASEVTVSHNPALNNFTGTNVQDVLVEADNHFDLIFDFTVGKTSLVGVYNATEQKVKLVFGGGSEGRVEQDKDLPAPSDENKNMYLFVSVGKPATSTGNAPHEALKVGDFVLSNGTDWLRIPTGDYLKASDIPITPITDLTGSSDVQNALENASVKIKAVSNRIDTLNASNVAFDNNTSAIPGADINTVQKAIDGLGGKYVTKTGGTLTGNLNANSNKITGLADGTDPEDAINKKQLDAIVQNLYGSGTSLVGRYSAATNFVIEKFGIADTAKIIPGQPLPPSGPANKNMYLYVSESGRGTDPAPQLTLNVGDLVFSSGTSWERINTSVTNVTAKSISVDPIVGVVGNNVQEALQSLATKPLTAQADNITVTPTITDLPGANVQAVLVGAAAKIKANTDKNTALEGRINSLRAAQISFDNQTSAIPGQTVDTVQKAIDGVISKLGNPGAVKATNVSVTSIAGITGDNVQTTLEQLKTKIETSITNLDAIYLKKTGDQLSGNIDANSNKITRLADPVDAQDAATKQFVVDQGSNYVTKTGGQLTGDLNANSKKITGLANPVNDQDASTKSYVDTNFVNKTNGILLGDLDANSKKIINLAAPTENDHAIRKIDLTTEVAKYVKKAGGQLDSHLDANTKKIINLADGADAGDAINKGQLDAVIGSLQSQLIGKLTFVGTYNANTNTISHVNTAISNQFPEYVAGQALPVDSAKFVNNFLIVTVKGTGVAPAPTVALNVGDLIYSSGTGWGMIPLGSTTAAVNVSVDPIAQLPGVSDVQAALNTLATRPAGTATAVTTSFNPTGNLIATNVQAAIEELDTEKAADTQVVKLTGDQVVSGKKTFSNPAFNIANGVTFTIQGDRNNNTYFQWRDNTGRYSYIGFGSSRRGSLQFVNDLPNSMNPIFEFNKVCRYNPWPTITDGADLINKGYADSKYVTTDTSQWIEANKGFRKPIEISGNPFPVSITGNRPGSRFDFLSDHIVTDASGNKVNKAPVEQNLILFPRGGAVTRVSGFQFDQIAESNVARGTVHFVLKYYNANHESLWFRLSFKPDTLSSGEHRVKCFVQGNVLSFHQTEDNGAPSARDNGVILAGIASATADSHAINRGFANVNYVRTGGNVAQLITGVKTFSTQIRAGYGGAYLRLTPEDNSTKTLYFSDTAVGANNKFHLDLERKCQLKNLVDPTNNYDAAHKKYVDDLVGVISENLTNVDVTASVASLAGKGSLTFSSRLTRDRATKDVLSALFGMKLTLTAPWNPGDSTTPTLLAGCQITGEEYYKGLPVVVDSSLTGGAFKTVAHIRLIKVVPDGGINQPQADAPIEIGRIVCKIDGGNTKLYAVFSHNSDIAVPTGTGAFFTVRYEGLPSMVI